MQKVVKLKENNDSVSIEIKMIGNYNCVYDYSLYQKEIGRIETFPGDNLHSDDDKFILKNDAAMNLKRTLVLDFGFHSRNIPPQDETAEFIVVFYQNGEKIDQFEHSEVLTGQKQFLLLFVKFEKK